MEREEKIAKSLIGSNSELFITTKDDVEIVYDIFESYLQIGMGGEWWGGKIKMGKNIFHHKKENIDSGYKPVIVVIKNHGEYLNMIVSGGFGYETSVALELRG